MSFDDSAISDVQAAQDATDLHVRWASADPEGTAFQVYLGRRLAWSGTARRAVIAAPPRGSLTRIRVGAVGPAEVDVDFSAGFAVVADRARLSWLGGTFLDPSGLDDVAGFKVYGSPAAGAPVGYATPLATVDAYPGGEVLDGFGLGGFGRGGFGRSASAYSWTSGRLGSGTWQFDVRPFDRAGNEQATTVPASIAITARPRPPAESAPGVRLTYEYDPITRVATIHWLPSPG